LISTPTNSFIGHNRTEILKMDNEQFRKYGHEIVDWIADFMDNIEKYPVHPDIQPGEIKTQLPKNAPTKGEKMEDILKDFQNIILPGITHWQHPCWFAYFPANNSPPSVLGEFLTSALGAQCMIWKTSPAAEELEEVTLEWLRKMVGLPEGMVGVIQDSASTSTLVALIAAREKASDFEVNKKGFAEFLTVYCSEEAHSSVVKGAKIAGYGEEHIRLIPADENFAMVPAKLEEAILEDIAETKKPACVCATLGTTSSAGVDPLGKIGAICKKHNLWLHVDAAYAGAAAILPEKRWIMDGIEYSDSFVFNPHKWLLTNFDCSAFFVRDPTTLKKVFEIHPEYLKTGVDAKVNNYRDWGIQLGRRFRALKLWFVLRSYGVEGLQNMVREHIRLAQMLKQWIVDDPRFEVMAPVDFSLVCFRCNPKSMSEQQLDELNMRLLESVNQTGKTLLTHTTLKGRYVIRFCIAQRTTREEHVKLVWKLITEEAEQLLEH
jgi:aromatic-L-amino-acid decarboxylase